MNNNDYLESLSKDAGVDLNLIKKKYENFNQNNLILNESNSRKTSQITLEKDSLETDLTKRLDMYRICRNCQGKGTIKSIYNHMVLEKECEECQGESIVFSENINKIINDVI